MQPYVNGFAIYGAPGVNGLQSYVNSFAINIAPQICQCIQVAALYHCRMQKRYCVHVLCINIMIAIAVVFIFVSCISFCKHQPCMPE
jgi:hypothetical protein